MKIINQMITTTILPDVWFQGIAKKGMGRGKKLGFPTINLKLNRQFSLKHGVYVCQTKIDNITYHGLLFYGPRPTFKEKRPSLEIFLLNFNQPVNLDKKISFRLIKFIRPVKKFTSAEQLIAQIHKDLEFIS